MASKVKSKCSYIFNYSNEEEQKPLRKATETILSKADMTWFQSQSTMSYKQSVCIFFSYSKDKAA